MPYIIIDLQGEQTAGGYLKIDGGRQIALSDDLVIPVSAGVHNLQFSSQSSAERGMTKANLAVGNYRTAAWSEKDSVDGTITETFQNNTVMFFTVVSDRRGHILDLPQYQMRQMDQENLDKIETTYRERIAAQEEYMRSTAGKEFFLCLFLGWAGVHKFYRGKIGWGLLYLFSGGLSGIGWAIDTLILLFKWLKAKKSKKATE